MTYAKVASLLAIITAIEFVIFYIEALEGVVVPMFLILSAVKFAMVAMFYMHLKFDSRLFSWFFVGGLVLATSVIMALLALFAIVSGDRIVVAVPDDTMVGDHGADGTATDTTTDAGTDTQMTDALSANFTHEIGSAASDDLQFDMDSLTATAGQEVILRFNNNAVTQQHNWVLVQSGTKDDVAAGGVLHPENWLNPDDSNVIASVRLLNAGEVGEVTFTAPDAGNYEFVCTFPGHNLTMYGTFEVTP